MPPRDVSYLERRIDSREIGSDQINRFRIDSYVQLADLDPKAVLVCTGCCRIVKASRGQQTSE